MLHRPLLLQHVCVVTYSALFLSLAQPPPRLPPQVLGHAKTFLVLLGGWLIFREVITGQQLLGMGIAVAGMVWYGAESNKPANVATQQVVTPTGASANGKRGNGEFAEPLLRGSMDGEEGLERKETV